MLTQKLTRQVVSLHDYPVATTNYGKLRGVEREGTFIFRGIKYADADRFMMPERPKAWEGTKNAVNFGYACPEMKRPGLEDNFYNPHFWQVQDENCQYLNVWTPTLDINAKKTVMFWIHGGGWNTGSSQELLAYDGENLSKFGDVVVVSVNHRLNCLGYLDLSSFGERYKNSALVGLADLVRALEWVHENIAAFGGDPDNVMIYGQSGGGSKVSFLMQTPSADGLYHKACLQSGGTRGGTAPAGWTLKDMSTRMGELVAEELGFAPENIEKIETVPYYFLAEAVKKAEDRMYGETGIKYRWEPIADYEYCFGSPFFNEIRKEALNIPLIVGGTFSEHSGNMNSSDEDAGKNGWSEEDTLCRMGKRYGEFAQPIAAAFKKAYPNHVLADALYLDPRDRSIFRKFAMQWAAAGGKIWNYLFNFESPLNGGTTAWHCSELPFMFHNAEYLEPSYVPGVTERLQDEMTGAWVSFAKTGNPNHDAIPVWPQVTRDSVPTMIFDKETCVVVDHDKELCKMLDQI